MIWWLPGNVRQSAHLLLLMDQSGTICRYITVGKENCSNIKDIRPEKKNIYGGGDFGRVLLPKVLVLYIGSTLNARVESWMLKD